MLWHSALTGYGFRDWIKTLTRGDRISQGQPLDPFSTSMRVFKYSNSWIGAINTNGYLSDRDSGDKSQSITDLQKAQLVRAESVEGQQNEEQIEINGQAVNIKRVSLTQLGENTLRDWQNHDLMNNNDDDELPRCLVLIQHAFALHNQYYIDMINFWCDIRKIFPIDDVLSNPVALYLMSYLNETINGFNPWAVIKATSEGQLDRQIIDWDQLRSQILLLDPDDHDLSSGIDKLKHRIDDASTRSTGRVNFCRALELFCSEPNEASVSLNRWRLSERAMDRCRRLLPLLQPIIQLQDPKTRLINQILLDRCNVILYGPPGTGKTYTAFLLANEWARQYGENTVFTVTFHPSFSYEDFVEGFRPLKDVPDRYILTDGILKIACGRAQELKDTTFTDNPTPKVLLLIDEINRGDVSKIFGELITYIEPDKRNKPVHLSQSSEDTFSIPDNLYFLGTMNTADKSISLLDVALRRRFAFIEFPPDPDFFNNHREFPGTVDNISLQELLKNLNKRLADQGVEIDRSIGHAYFLIKNNAEDPLLQLRRAFEYDIVPLVSEYCYTDRDRVRNIFGAIVDEYGRIKTVSTLSNQEFLTLLLAISNPGNIHGAPVRDELEATIDTNPDDILENNSVPDE